MATKLTVSEPLVPNESGITHTGTSWQVSKEKTFTDVGSMILDAPNDTIHLLKNEISYTPNENEVIFVRIKYHFSNDESTRWSEILSVYKRDDVQHIKPVIIVTPTVYIDAPTINGNEDVRVTSTPFYLYVGNTEHVSTTWSVKTTAGVVLWSREKDVDNLTNIIIPKEIFLINESDALIVTATYHDDDYIKSHEGKLTVVKSLRDKSIQIPNTESLFTTGMNSIEVVVYLGDVVDITWKLLDNDGNEIVNPTSTSKRYIYIDGQLLTPDEEYILVINGTSFYNGVIEERFILPAVERILVCSNTTFNTLIDPDVTTSISDLNSDNFTMTNRDGVIPIFDHQNDRLTFFEIEDYNPLIISASNYQPNIIVGDLNSNNFKYHTKIINNDVMVSVVAINDEVHLYGYQFDKNAKSIYELFDIYLPHFDDYIQDVNSPLISFDQIDANHIVLVRKTDTDIEMIKINIYTYEVTVEGLPSGITLDGNISVKSLCDNRLYLFGKNASNAFIGVVYDMITSSYVDININMSSIDTDSKLLYVTNLNNNELLIMGLDTDDKYVSTKYIIDTNTWEDFESHDLTAVDTTLIQTSDLIILLDE